MKPWEFLIGRKPFSSSYRVSMQQSRLAIAKTQRLGTALWQRRSFTHDCPVNELQPLRLLLLGSPVRRLYRPCLTLSTFYDLRTLVRVLERALSLNASRKILVWHTCPAATYCVAALTKRRPWASKQTSTWYRDNLYPMRLYFLSSILRSGRLVIL